MGTKKQKLTFLALAFIFLVGLVFSAKVVEIALASHLRALNDELKTTDDRISAIEKEVEKKNKELEQKSTSQNRTAAR